MSDEQTREEEEVVVVVVERDRSPRVANVVHRLPHTHTIHT
jgi:hypothetical protein